MLFSYFSSPKSSPVPQEVEVFDYARFIDDQLSINDPNMMKKSIQIASKNVRSWDLTKLAKTVFDKSVAQGDHEKFVTFSIVVNHEVAFKQTLTSIAINALENELLNPNPALNKTANSIAEFVCELFKIDWISNNLIHRCIGLIASDQFESLKRIKILHTLIKPIAMKIKKIPNDDSLIFYSKKIQSKTVSITDYESHLLCTEAAKILEIIATQNDDSAMHFKPPSHIDMITIILNSFTDYLVCANRIKTMNVSETVDLNFLVDTIISKTMANTEQVENFAKLVMELSDIPVIAPNGSVNLFKVLLVSKCQNKYLATFACTQIDPLIVQSIFALTRFIAYLYMLDVVNEDFLIPCIEVLFRNERSCSNTVFCINILFQTIGKKIENKNKHFLTRYYTIFESVVNNEESARSFIYSKLIELRNNKWIEGSSKAKLTIELKDFGDCKKMETVIESMKRHLKTSNIVRQFIAAVLNFSLVDHKSIQNCAQFFINFQEITLESDVTFNEILNRSVQSELEKFNRKQTLNRDEKKLFASLLTLTGELYREDIVSDEDLHTCLLARQVNQISLDELAHLSLIISPKIQQKGSKHLKTVLGMLENIIHDVTMDVCMEIKTDLIDLTDVMQSCQEHNVHQTNT